MGFLDSLFSASATTFNIQQAIMTVVVAAVKVDGDVANEEILRIKSMCALSPVFAANTSQQDDTLIRFADNVTNQMKEQAIEQAASTLSPELRETAFAFACDMILADGLVGDAEQRFLRSLSERLQINDETGKAVVMTTLIRNRGGA